MIERTVKDRTGNGSAGRLRVLLWTALIVVIAVAAIAGVRSMSRRSSTAAANTGSDRSAGGPAGSMTGTSLEEGRSELPIGEPLPPFSLTERTGRKIRGSDLEGRVWIANFIFTRCPDVCPDLTRKMAAVRARLAESGHDDVLSVSFSVDPVHDTPETLAKYAESLHAGTDDWLFLTGDPKELLRLVKDGFHLAMVDPAEGAPIHSNRFVLVDAKGRVRASHLGTEEDVVEAIVQEALVLRREAS